MSAPIYVPEQTLVQWYFSPSKVERTERPKEPFDYPVEDLQASIDLTMRYITAAPQPLLDRSGRHLQTVAGPNDALTLFWPIYVDSNITVIVDCMNCLDQAAVEQQGFTYIGVGTGN